MKALDHTIYTYVYNTTFNEAWYICSTDASTICMFRYI